MKPDRELKRQLSGGRRVGSEAGSLTRCRTDRLGTGQTDTPALLTSVWSEQHTGQTTRGRQTEAALLPKLLAAHYRPGIRTFVSCQSPLISTGHVLHERILLTRLFSATRKRFLEKHKKSD